MGEPHPPISSLSPTGLTGTHLPGATHTSMQLPRSVEKLSSSKVACSPMPQPPSTVPTVQPPMKPPPQPSTPGRYFWRLTRDGHLVSLQPAHLHRFWRGLPLHLDSVDAVYERLLDHKIVFFKGGAHQIAPHSWREPGAPLPTASTHNPIQCWGCFLQSPRHRQAVAVGGLRCWHPPKSSVGLSHSNSSWCHCGSLRTGCGPPDGVHRASKCGELGLEVPHSCSLLQLKLMIWEPQINLWPAVLRAEKPCSPLAACWPPGVALL